MGSRAGKTGLSKAQAGNPGALGTYTGKAGTGKAGKKTQRKQLRQAGNTIIELADEDNSLMMQNR